MEKILNTNSFSIKYIDNIKTKPHIILELYRGDLYKKFIEKLLFSRLEYIKKLLEKYPKFDVNDNNIFISEPLLIDIVSIFILNHEFKSDIDPIFDIKSPFEKSHVKAYFDNNCLPTIPVILIDPIVEILSDLSETYILYFDNIKQNMERISELKYNITFEITNNMVTILFKFMDRNEIIDKLKQAYNFTENNQAQYPEKIVLPLHIFKHLVKLYNTKVHNNYLSSDVIDNKVIEYIYSIIIRYSVISNGNNQASILPSFKKIIKEKLNIKVELFGSPLNTSSATFGSIFYDIDHVFGSIGNYFNNTILKGFYEINPVFDKCLIDRMLIKSTNELLAAEKNKNPLLFLYILPYSYFKYNTLPDNISRFIKFETVIQKDDFPYIRYNRNFSKTNVSPIVITKIIICHTSCVNDFIKFNTLAFPKILKEWVTKKNK